MRELLHNNGYKMEGVVIVIVGEGPELTILTSLMIK